MSTIDLSATRDKTTVLEPWKKRRESARKARRPFEATWMENQAFAAGNQWVKYLQRDHRVINTEEIRRELGRSTAQADILTQNLWTAIGKFTKDDFRPQLLFQHDDEEAEEYTQAANKAFGWGWDEEWRGDEVLNDLLLTLVTFGTGALRCRYDRTKGPLAGDFPYPGEDYRWTNPETQQESTFAAGKPILDDAAARAYVGEAKYYGEDFTMKPLHEGAIVWDILSPWNLLPPPAVESERNFPWHLIVRPVHLDDLKEMYGEKAGDVKADELEAMNILGLRDTTLNSNNTSQTTTGGKLEDHALVYTGYEMPCPKYPRGQTVVFTHDDHVLDVEESLPYNAPPHGARPGISYFHYWRVKQRFWGRALIEPGIGPQRIHNKRKAQNDETIDRTLPKVFEEEGAIVSVPAGLPMERVLLKPGAPKPLIENGGGPGPWMAADREQNLDDLERALGLHSVSLGQSASASAPYARLALESENDADKLDPIVKDFKLNTADVSRDTLEAMKQWPEGKELLIAGEDDRLESFIFSRSHIPRAFMCKPAKGATIRSLGAELQKVNDIAVFAQNAGVVARDPLAWLDWYKNSLDNAIVEEFPSMPLLLQQKRQAALENIVMSRTGQVLPVSPEDDPTAHLEEHTQHMIELHSAAAEGDEEALMLTDVFQQHRQLHLQQAQMNAAQNPMPPGPVPPTPPPAA